MRISQRDVLRSLRMMHYHITPLAIGVNVHLNTTVGDGGVDLGLGRARSSVEDEVAVNRRDEVGSAGTQKVPVVQ